MRHIDEIILHCSATPEGRDVSVATIRKWHKDRGWSDIGYHYVIYLDGSIHKGRSVERIGAHVKGHNRGTIGICYVGGVDSKMKAKDTRTDAQKKAIVTLIKELKADYPAIKKVSGHNEYAAKACPSFKVGRTYDYLIDDTVKPSPQPVAKPKLKGPEKTVKPAKTSMLLRLLELIFKGFSK